jgi:hypothetical protein
MEGSLRDFSETARQGDEIVQREVGGPVVSVTPFTATDDAIARANNSEYGLALIVWTQNGPQVAGSTGESCCQEITEQCQGMLWHSRKTAPQAGVCSAPLHHASA